MRGKGFDDMVSVTIETVAWAIREEVNVVVKLHPAEARLCSEHPLTYNKLLADPRWQLLSATWRQDRVLFVDWNNTLNTYKLIEMATVVVTAVSGSGLEALVMHKEVCASHYVIGNRAF